MEKTKEVQRQTENVNIKEYLDRRTPKLSKISGSIKSVQKKIKMDKPNGATIFDRIKWFVYSKKRNAGAILLGTGQILTAQGATNAASIINPIGWVLLIVGVIHSLIKDETQKVEEYGYGTLDYVVKQFVEFVDSLKAYFKKGEKND